MQFLLNSEPSDECTVPLYFQNGTSIDIVPSNRSKYFYNNFVTMLTNSSSKGFDKWKEMFDLADDEQTDIWLCKVKAIKDKKVAETNYKILHQILPCNKNLVKKKNRDNDECDVYNETQDIAHLSFNCKHAKAVWHDVENVLGLQLLVVNVLFGRNIDWVTNTIISLVCHFIYKE